MFILRFGCSLTMDENVKKRNRTIMSSKQIRILNKYFNINSFPSTAVREELGKILDMKPRTVQVWFQNQRQKKKFKDEYVNMKEEKMEPLKILAELATCVVDRENRKEYQK
ncbi:Homeodomain protein [Spraguea lophii 42_110]|uniref:Homeodomain protein n=1 Tax=Spraguea lophii (strain 42_110) TaxID=1358809 RepID=S7W910_SPRLO|nr:Homeodomain protein [Spraguea lophii 42_110]